MKVYISGKITGTDDYIKRFAEVETNLLKLGLEVVNPTKIDDGGEKKPWEWYMKECLKLLLDCDAIYMLADWKISRGATIENYVARQLNMVLMMEGINYE